MTPWVWARLFGIWDEIEQVVQAASGEGPQGPHYKLLADAALALPDTVYLAGWQLHGPCQPGQAAAATVIQLKDPGSDFHTRASGVTFGKYYIAQNARCQ